LALNGTALASAARVIDLGPEFSRFWSAAANLPFPRQVAIWEKEIEAPQRDFYESIVWNRKQDPEWRARRLRRLTAAFQQYRKYAPEMEKRFREFPALLAREAGRFRRVFPDARLDAATYAVPSPTFDGKVDSLASRPTENVLAFGIDEIVDNQDDPDVLFIHEFFHVYQGERAGLNGEVFVKQGKFSLPLWEEGFATYASELLNPSAPREKILLSAKLVQVPPAELPRLAAVYLEHIEEPALNPRDPSLYKTWFTSGTPGPLPGLPPRCGYLLGLELVRHLSQTHPPIEMAGWRLPEIHRQVIQGLREMQQGASR
jgi:hypothetical protein